MSYGQLPFGMREIILRDESGFGLVALPRSILLAVTERLQSTEFMAETVLVAAETYTVAADWELEAGGISLDVLAKFTGRTVDEYITSPPNRQRQLLITNGETFPYVQIYGRSVGDAKDDIYVKIQRAKLTSIEGTLRQREFYITSCAGVALPDSSGEIYRVVQREAGVPL